MYSRERYNKGGSLVELALLLPLLVLILAGVVDLGRAFHDYIIINNASREGARFASHWPNDELGIKETARDEAVGTGVSISTTLVTVNCPVDCSDEVTTSGKPITVTVQFPFQIILGRILGVNTITMTSHTSMVVFGYDNVGTE